MKPHKHAAIIKAWANGSKVECRWRDAGCRWVSIEHPDWSDNFEYRVSPEYDLARVWETTCGTISLWTSRMGHQDLIESLPAFGCWRSETFTLMEYSDE